ncbi:MAG TPA: oxidoreductase, partial [Dehalococcoidia bacterium]|nr:oxidoreductase [Dehalococcoidia bacterium]
PFTKGGGQSASQQATDTVVLLNDTYMNHNYPEIGKSAVALLEAAGFNVVLSDTQCCGRPMISKGLLDSATSNAVANVDTLYEYAQQGIPVIGCEPSCLLTFRDEYPELVRDERARKVAENSFMIDEFLMKLQEDGQLDLDLGKLEKKVLFQAHCHQKSDMGTATSMGALRLAPGYQVEMVNAGCCGMAGSFGYEKEHYDLSMKIGEEALFPAIRAKDGDWEVAVMGVSCRQQVEHGTGRKARHLVEVLADALM